MRRSKGRKPVSGLMTGVVFTLAGALCFVPIYYSYFLGLSSPTSKIIVAGVALVIAFGTGYFIPSLRDAGFYYYKTVYKKRQKRIAEAKKKGKTIRKYGRWQNFLYWKFRDGSVAEECATDLKNKQSGESRYIFLKECKTEQDAANLHRKIAALMAIKYPDYGIYETYNEAEKWQGIDTGFLLFSALAVILAPLNWFLNFFKGHDFQVVLPLVFGALFLAVHKISKSKSKDVAARYLSNINSGWEKMNSEDKEAIMKTVFGARKIENSTIAIGDNITINSNITTTERIDSESIIQKLMERAISKEAIEKIKDQIADIVAEHNKKKPDKNKLEGIFANIGKIGGSALQAAITAIVKSLMS